MKLNKFLFERNFDPNKVVMRDPNLIITIICPTCKQASTFNSNKITVATLPKEPSLGCNHCGHIWKGKLEQHSKWVNLIDIIYGNYRFEYGYKTEIGILKLR